uniref:Secreted protein n=1 Tax=Anopheles coluzzii TaxID=1518534 RepID=A0A8W7PKG2_ANOCL
MRRGLLLLATDTPVAAATVAAARMADGGGDVGAGYQRLAPVRLVAHSQVLALLLQLLLVLYRVMLVRHDVMVVVPSSTKNVLNQKCHPLSSLFGRNSTFTSPASGIQQSSSTDM